MKSQTGNCPVFCACVGSETITMSNFANVTVTMEGVLSVLYAFVAVLILIVLYHLLFIVVDLRKIMRRFEDTTAQVEAIILKPLSVIDEAFSWVVDHVQHSKKKKKGKDEKPFDVKPMNN